MLCPIQRSDPNYSRLICSITSAGSASTMVTQSRAESAWLADKLHLHRPPVFSSSWTAKTCYIPCGLPCDALYISIPCAYYLMYWRKVPVPDHDPACSESTTVSVDTQSLHVKDVPSALSVLRWSSPLKQGTVSDIARTVNPVSFDVPPQRSSAVRGYIYKQQRRK